MLQLILTMSGENKEKVTTVDFDATRGLVEFKFRQELVLQEPILTIRLVLLLEYQDCIGSAKSKTVRHDWKIRKTNQRFPYQAKYTHCSRSTKRWVLSLNFSQQGILLPDHGCLAHINTRRFHSHRNEQAGVFLPLEMNYLTLGLVSLIGGGCAAT